LPGHLNPGKPIYEVLKGGKPCKICLANYWPPIFKKSLKKFPPLIPYPLLPCIVDPDFFKLIKLCHKIKYAL
jgi:hypothetical protein